MLCLTREQLSSGPTAFTQGRGPDVGNNDIMSKNAIFAGLVQDEDGNPIETGFVGEEAHYIINDQGFRRHVPAEQIDRYIVEMFVEQVQDHKDMAIDQGLRMMGKDDLFSKAALDASIRNIDADQILKQGIPQQARDMMGMMGFRIIVNYRGEVVRIDQPAAPEVD
jgi:hypothetical protein